MKLLLYLAERFVKHIGAEVLIDAPITHQDIADSISMNRETGVIGKNVEVLNI